MAQFLWTGRDGRGAACAFRDEAASAEQSRAALEAAGYTELQLKSDDLGDAVKGTMRAGGGKIPIVTPELEVQLLEGGVSRAPALVDALRKKRSALAVAGAITCLGLFLHNRWLIFVPPIASGLELAVAYALEARIRLYNRIVAAKVWGRWREVLPMLDRLDRVGRILGEPSMQLEITRNRAMAHAALGRKGEGLRLLEGARATREIPEFLFQTMLNQVHSAARDFQESIACSAAACKANPDNASLWVDHAVLLARRTTDLEGARAALAEASSRPLPDFGEVFLPYARGIIALRAGHPDEALRELEVAEAGQVMLVQRSPISVAVLLIMRSYLCLAAGLTGDRARARRLLAEVERFLIAHREEDLLAECRAATADAGGSSSMAI